MFTPLTPAQLISAIGVSARDAARSQQPLDDFARGQLKSAYSASRHLAIVLESFGPPLRDFAAAVTASAQRTAAEAAAEEDPAAIEALAARLARTQDAHAIGDTVCRMLELCRSRPGRPWSDLRADIRGSLRVLCDSEVAILAAGLEQGR
jgi:hypothetical protein